MTSCIAPAERPASRRAFTLIELVVVLTVLTVMAGAAVPAFRILSDEGAASEPADLVLDLVRDVRQRVIRENRPYQLVFGEGKVTATALIHPYLEAGEIEDYLTELSAARDPSPASTAVYRQYELDPFADEGEISVVEREPPWKRQVILPEDVQLAVKAWNDARPVVLERSVQRAWIVRPGGLADPMTLSFIRGGVAVQLSFDAMTFDLETGSEYEN